MNKISMAVAKKSLDVAKSQGDLVVQLIQGAASTSTQQGGPNGNGRLDLFG